MNKEFEAYKTALRYAENAHRGQVRKYSDSPYILHLLPENHHELIHNRVPDTNKLFYQRIYHSEQ